MSYLEELRASRDKKQTVYTEFALSVRKFPTHLFCFFEGNDNGYYVPRIKKFTSDYVPIYCNGREKVLGVYELIINKTEYDKYKKAFFIDRDFNVLLDSKNPPIFETPCYSIENLYVSLSVFEEILINSFHLSPTTDLDFEKCKVIYQERQNEFHSATLLFNAWYACLIDKRNNENIETGVNLSDKFPKGFVEIDLNEVKSNYDLEKIKAAFENAIPILEEDLIKKIEEFESVEAQKTFRGKYELNFMITILDLLVKDSKTENQFLESKINFLFYDSLNIEKAIEVFSSYAETPPQLDNYLKEVTK